MTSLTWNYNTPSRLIGCGIDAERVDRFDSFVHCDEHPMPFVFSGEEVKHFNQLLKPAKGFCAAFCCKEALLKAISKSYNFAECELFLDDSDLWHAIKLSESLHKEYGIDSAIVRIEFFNHIKYTECLAAVYLFEKP